MNTANPAEAFPVDRLGAFADAIPRGIRGWLLACALLASMPWPSSAAADEIHVEHTPCPPGSKLWVHWRDDDGLWRTRRWAIDDHAAGARLTYDGGKAVDTPDSRLFIDFDVPPTHEVTIHNTSPKVWGEHRTVAGRRFTAYADSAWFRFNLVFHCTRQPTGDDNATCDLAEELHARLVDVRCKNLWLSSADAGEGDSPATAARRLAFDSCVGNALRRGPEHSTMGSLLSGRCDQLVRSLRTKLAAYGESDPAGNP